MGTKYKLVKLSGAGGISVIQESYIHKKLRLTALGDVIIITLGDGGGRPEDGFEFIC